MKGKTVDDKLFEMVQLALKVAEERTHTGRSDDLYNTIDDIMEELSIEFADARDHRVLVSELTHLVIVARKALQSLRPDF